ncbi:hypothetical protein [Phosphitispora fastidiosa]|uniref:hypothetical protein n=1 Tax=Phosphitispora fastidiosa TaxID=2837202 RepID=UPI001E340E9F|nr:hypothetical protein [Phosphitispora fastidiosa]MBU7006303.1 hypothetical protein [Phosphitispora fastidiosa]
MYIDDTYYIDPINMTEDNAVGDLLLCGDNGSLIFYCNTVITDVRPVLFRLTQDTKTVLIKNIQFINESTLFQPRIMAGYTDTEQNVFDIEEFTFKNNKTSGYMVGFRATCPVESDSVFRSINITDNKIINPTALDYAVIYAAQFINIENYSYGLCTIQDNIIKNSSCFLYDGLTSERTNNKEMLMVSGNIMVNDDDWYLDGDGAVYNCMVLSEAKEIHYTYNWVEGIKTNHEHAMVYSAYLTGQKVYCENNVYRNNVKLAIDSTDPLSCDNIIFKVKGIVPDSVRVIKNNKAYVSKEYINKAVIMMGAEINTIYRVIEFPYVLMPEMIFEGNDIYVEHQLSFRVSISADNAFCGYNKIAGVNPDYSIACEGLIETDNEITTLSL